MAAILAIRAYLSLTGYPQVGNGSLHIAHMLWGGLLLTVALGALLLFASRRWKPFAAIVGGLGFGTFIDELGKFITEDNDYFYQPTIALIYLVLIGLFLDCRTLAQRDSLSPREHIFYAVSAMELLAMGRLDEDNRNQALRHLDASGDHFSSATSLREALVTAEVIQREPGHLSRWFRTGVAWYRSVASTKWFGHALLALFFFQALLFLASVGLLVATRDLTFADGLSFFE